MINPYAPPVEGGSLASAPLSGRLLGTFRSPLIGAARAPAGVTGEGAMTATVEGLLVEGRRVATTMISCLGLLGAVFGAIACGFVAAASKLKIEQILITIGLVGGAFAGAWLGRALGGRRPFTATVPWGSIRDASLIGNRLAFTSSSKPKGWYEFFAHPDGIAELQRIAFYLSAKR